MAQELVKEAQDMRKTAIAAAILFRTQHPDMVFAPVPVSGWSFETLQKEGGLNFVAFIEKNSDAFKMQNQGAIDVNAFRVPQRGCAFLSQAEITAGKRLGTDNLQQCVALVADGIGLDGKRKVVLMHVDKYTNPEEVHTILSGFQDNDQLKIITYGAKDQYRMKFDYEKQISVEVDTPQKAVSQDNLKVVNGVISALGLEDRVDREQSKSGREARSPNFIYNPTDRTTSEGVFPNGGFQIAEATEKVRRTQNLSQGKTINDTRVSGFEDRDKKLRIVPTTTPTDYDKYALEPSLKCEMLNYYKTKGCDEFLEEIARGQEDASGGQYDRQMKSCSSLQHFMEVIQDTLSPPKRTLEEILHKTGEMDQIIDQKIEEIQSKAVVERQVKEMVMQFGDKPAIKDMGKQEVKLLEKTVLKRSGVEQDDLLTKQVKEMALQLGDKTAKKDMSKKEVKLLERQVVNKLSRGGYVGL